jgi:hypothetical protein
VIDAIATTGLALAWAGCCFTALQLVDRRSRFGLVALTTGLIVGLAMLAVRDGSFGISWIRSPRLHSDAISLGSIAPMLAVGAAVILHPHSRRSTWGPATLLAVSSGCVLAAFAALVLGRSSWYWEFVALIAGGALMLLGGSLVAMRRRASPNLRVVFGAIGAFGAFLVGGGTLMLLAWRSLAPV